MKKEIVDRYDE